MSTTTSTVSSSEQIRLSKLVWVAPLAIVASTAANLTLYFMANALVGVEWLPMFNAASVAGSTMVYLLAAAAIFAAVARFARRPVWLYQRIALAALVLSFFAPVSALLGLSAAPAPVDTFITMLVMHAVAYLISVNLFVRLAKD